MTAKAETRHPLARGEFFASWPRTISSEDVARARAWITAVLDTWWSGPADQRHALLDAEIEYESWLATPADLEYQSWRTATGEQP